ncbi:MAG: hypothetical protein JWQ21_2955 [Herminiimonas sp.]|nr:hypothetical protein [Herminiimonas sp.]
MDLSAKYASEHSLTLDTSLTLHDLGISAFDGSNVERGALGAFLNAIKQGRIQSGSYLLVESLDRLSRERTREALNLFLSILGHGITIVTLADNKVYSPTGDDNGYDLIFSILIMQRAHEESVTKSRRIKAAWSNKRSHLSEKKLTAQCPKWMKLNDSKTAFEVIPERAEIVEEILDLAKNGMGQAQIAKILNERSIPPFSNYGKGWHNSYIQKILTSTALYGKFQPGVFENGRSIPHGDPVEDYYPALITKEEFFLLQGLRSERAIGGAKAKKGDTVPNLLSGIAKCGYCGCTMILVGAAAKRVRAPDGTETKRPSKKVLVCDGARRGLNCYAVQWNYKDFEKSFLTFCRGLELERILTNFDHSTTTKEKKLSISDQLQATNAEIGTTDTQLDRLVSAIALGDAPSSVMKRINDTEAKLVRLTKQKMKLETELHAIEGANRHHEMAGESIRDLIAQMDSISSDALFSVRVALADHIRRFIEVVKVCPAGRLYTLEQVQRQRTALINSGFPEDRVDDYLCDNHPTSPKRQGRGIRGRYGSRKDIGRHFSILAKNGGYRVVYPDFDDPSILKVGSEVVQTENGDYRMIHSDFDDPFRLLVEPSGAT